MKWYHLIVWGGVVFTATKFGEIRAKMEELHLEPNECHVSVSHTI